MGGNKPVILGLDVSSSSTGYAILRNGRWSKSKSSYGLIKAPSNLTLPERLYRFRDSISELLVVVNPTHVIIEDVFSGRNVSTMKLLARFNGVAIEVCRRYLGKDPKVALTAEVRSNLECGRGKEEAFSYICKRYKLDWDFKKMNDVTDAVALALYYHNILKES